MTANGTALSAPPAAQPVLGPLPGARAALILLLAINLFNYIDRQVLAAVLPKIKVALVQDDPNQKAKLGALTTAFLVSYMVLAPVFGWLGDRMSRWFLVAIGVILWSLASGASGLAMTFWILLLTRCFVGVGEAAYGPVAPTMISDLYPVRQRGSKLAWFYVAIPVGGALGYVLGGAVDSWLGWRWAFFLVVPPGLLLGVWCFLMREPPRGQAEIVPPPPAEDTPPGDVAGDRPTGLRAALSGALGDYLFLTRIPSYLFVTLGMTAMTFAVGGIAAWMPYYIYEREARFVMTEKVFRDLAEDDEAVPAPVLAKLRPLEGKEFYPIKEFETQLKELLTVEELRKHQERIIDVVANPSLGWINVRFGAITVISGLGATLLGGWLGDRLRSRFPGSYFLVSGVSMMIAFPLVLAVPWTPFPLAWGLIFGAVFCLFFNTGPTNTILANVTHPSVRATAFALNIFVIHLFGDAISPVVMGVIADGFNMGVSLQIVSLIILAGGVFWLWGAPHLEGDTARAPTRHPRLEPPKRRDR
jgi:MFS family permease